MAKADSTKVKKTSSGPGIKPISPAKVAQTEVEAYGFIREQLRDLGWKVKNPSLNSGGQVWTQNQCLSDPSIKLAFGKNRPENVVQVAVDRLWIIEAKAARKDLEKAVNEAEVFYSKAINALPGKLRAVLATGVAGTEELGYLIRTKVRLDGKWQDVTINGKVATGLLSPDQSTFLLANNVADVHEYAPPQRLFLVAAERINEILHMGGINKNDRAKTMAALLLSVIDEPPSLDTKLSVLIGEINLRSKEILSEHGKPDFAPFVQILAPTNAANHPKFKAALVRTIQELQNLNIRSAMNSSTDVLGQFYEVFLKYGNGAKEIGIVLTPRHITRFAVEAVGISCDDIVFDPACGTGGFLVAAFDHVRKNSSPQQRDRFKKYNIFGVEQESAVAALAIVNMIFRGDGKNNIIEGNCFSTYLKRKTISGHASAAYADKQSPGGEESVTRVLMNPPFALRGSVEKEFRFVTHALSQMADGKILLALIPLNVLFGSNEEKVWRRDELLAKHTLLSVISLPEGLFLPAAKKQVACLIVKKGIPQSKDQPVFWARVAHDGYVMSKSKRLPAAELEPPRFEPDQLPEVLPALQSFLANPAVTKTSKPKLYKTAAIDPADPLLELLPEAYLDTGDVTDGVLENEVNAAVLDTAAFLVRSGKAPTAAEKNTNAVGAFTSVRLDSIFEIEPGHYHSVGHLPKGEVPMVSCGDANNGVIGNFDVEEHLYSDKLTIASNGATLTAKYHPYRFAAKDDVAICTPRKPLRLSTLFFIQVMINREKWRYSYYRKCYKEKLERVPVDLPMKNGQINEDLIEKLMKGNPHWDDLEQRVFAASALANEQFKASMKEDLPQ